MNDPHVLDISLRLVFSLVATLFVGACGAFLMFLRSLENKTDAALNNFSAKFNDMTEVVTAVGADLRVLIERTTAHEKRLDRLDLRKVRNDS